MVAAQSCGLGPTALVRLVLPDPPAPWRQAFPELTFLVVYQDSTGPRVTVTAMREVTVECGKAGNTPVLAYPAGIPGEDEQGVPPGLLRPAGALYPLDLDPRSEEPTLNLSWQEGPLAALVARLQENGMEVSLLNTARLQERFGTFQDPWDLDLESMATGLLHGTFSAYDVDSLPLRDAALVPGPGKWFLESPLSPPVEASASGELTLTQISPGSHSLFSTGGSWLRLYVWPKEVTVMRER